MLDISKIKIEIITRQNVPININNPVLTYIQDRERKSDRLFVRIFYNGITIGKGIILDFYKQFEIIEDFGEPQTRVVSFEYNGSTKYKNTYFGEIIYKIKNFKNPPIDEVERGIYIKEIASIFNAYLVSIKNESNSLKLTYIPSSSKVSEYISHNLSELGEIEILKVIDKNPNHTLDSKNILTFQDSLEHAQNKYIFDEQKIRENYKSQFIVIDDVFGNGSTIFTALKKLYDITQMTNYFFIVVKDVKR